MHTRLPVSILATKVQIPPSRRQLVSRQRLLRILASGLHRKLTLISAPAGYGKSTLLLEWATGCEWPVGWVTLEAGDNDIERFLTYLISAVQAAGVSPAGLDGILGARFSLQPLPPDAMLAILVNQLPTAVARLVVVLEDYHHIEDADVHSFVSALLDHLPPNIHMVISTRADPPLRLANLRAKDQMNEIRERDLRFTLKEAGAFFEEVMGLRLTGEQVAALEARTEGWVTGLQLVGLSLKDREHPSELIQTLAGTHRYILDYLMQEVFSDLPAHVRTFLLHTSILERLSSELCDAVVGDLSGSASSSVPTRSQEILKSLDAANLFVVPLDSQRQWYRFHALFADFLRHRLATQRADELPGLHRRAADWYVQNDLLSEAVEHSLAGADVNRAADLIQGQARDLLTRGEINTLNRWTASLPDDVLQARPRLGLARAWATLMSDPLAFRATVDEQIRQIAVGFGIQPRVLLSALAESEPGSARRAGLAEFAMLLAFAQRDVTDVYEAIELFKAAFDYLPDDEGVLRSFALAGLASAYVRAGAIRPAEEAFAQAAHLSLAAGSVYGYVASTDWQATMQAEQGQLTRAAAAYRRAIATLSGHGRGALPLSGHVYVGLASVLLEWNELAEALEKVRTGLQIGAQVGDIDALLKGYVLQARILHALGKPGEAREAAREAESQALETRNQGCVQEAQAWKAHLALAAGDMQAAQRWASARGLGSGASGQMPEGLDEIEQLTYIRLMMASGRSSEALPNLQVLIAAQEQAGRTRLVIEALALQVLCLRALGRSDEALRALARALLLAAPEGFIRVFIQEGAAMAALLRTAGTQGHSPDYVKRLLAAFGETTAPRDAVLDPLSERELEVLRLVAEGLTNAQIADRLVVAGSTVKTHINRIYRKLAVTTRTEAVARARQLQILP
ncbi:MAG TPA: LuxR C-terminal-related transcriptional regulator [Anaerolineales bacterium]